MSGNNYCECGVYYYNYSLFPQDHPSHFIQTPDNCLKCGKKFAGGTFHLQA